MKKRPWQKTQPTTAAPAIAAPAPQDLQGFANLADVRRAAFASDAQIELVVKQAGEKLRMTLQHERARARLVLNQEE